MDLYKRIVIKAGTALLTGGSGRLNSQVMGTLVEQMVKLRQRRVEIIFVSSGAVAAGRHVLSISEDGKKVPVRQVLAAAGQARLMHAYEQLFNYHQVPVAQALLTRKDLIDRQGYLNVRNTLLSLLELRAIPIVNENDVVASEEITGEVFGDNDNLSAMVANLVDADLLVMLGDVEGLFTADPYLDPAAQLISTVDCLKNEVEVAVGVLEGSRGRGGMATKLEAARLATAAGVEVVIASGLENEVLLRLADGERIGTYFPATHTKVESRKRWMLSGLSGGGKIVVDEGARAALLEDNRSLLSAGIKNVEGSFERGDIISILDGNCDQIAVGIINYSSSEVFEIKGVQSVRIQEILGYHLGDEVVHRSNMAVL